MEGWREESRRLVSSTSRRDSFRDELPMTSKNIGLTPKPGSLQTGEWRRILSPQMVSNIFYSQLGAIELDSTAVIRPSAAS